MSFLTDQIQGGAVKPETEEKSEEVIKQEEIVDETIKEETIETKEEVVAEVKVEEETKEEVIDEAPSKIEVDYSPWLSENESTLYQYLKEKNTDYKSLAKEDVVRLKIKKDNPEFDDKDVADEMSDKYGIGLKLINIDEDNMSVEEIEEAKRYNKEVERLQTKGQREIKKDAAIATKFFEDQKAGITLPKFEIDAPKAKVEKAVEFDEESYSKALVAQVQEQKEQHWIPALKKIIDPLESITEKVEYEDNGNKVVLDVTYKLSKEEKESVLNQLSDYVTQPSDAQYLDAQGVPDVQRFVQDKTREMQMSKLLKTVAKEAAALARKSFVKNDLINFSDEGKQVGIQERQESDFASTFFGKAAATKKQL